MPTSTLTLSDKVKSELKRFKWVNWSEVAKENLSRKKMLEELHKRLESKEEKELTKWSVELGRKAKKGRLKRLLAELSTKEREELLK